MSHTATATRTAADIITIVLPNGETKVVKGKNAAKCSYVIVSLYGTRYRVELRGTRDAAEAALADNLRTTRSVGGKVYPVGHADSGQVVEVIAA